MAHLFSLTCVIRRGHNYTEPDLSLASIEWYIEDQPGFLDVVWFPILAQPSSPPFLSVSSTSESATHKKTWEAEKTCWREGGGEGGGRGAESYNRMKAWSSIKHSILSACQYRWENSKLALPATDDKAELGFKTCCSHHILFLAQKPSLALVPAHHKTELGF